MYLLYIDESGDPTSWKKHNTFVFGGVAVFEGEVNKLVSAVNEVQKRYWPEIRVPLPLHASAIKSRRDRFRELDSGSAKQLMRDVYQVIAEAHWPGLVLFATAVDITYVEPGEDPDRYAFEDICQRFNTFLVRQFNKGFKDKGLLILEKSGREARYRHLIAEFLEKGTQWGYLGNIVDIPLFVGSSETRMIQFADFCAYAVFQYFEHRDREFLDIIYDRFDKGDDGRVHGLRHLVGEGID